MFDPFKRARKKATRRLRRTAASAVTDAWGVMLAPAKPAKHKRAKKTALTTGPHKSAVKAKPAKPAASPKPPATSQSKVTTPRGATFNSGTCKSAYGTRAYKLYQPAVVSEIEAPLPWSCHGYVPASQLIYAAFRSNAKGLFPPSDE